jgi:hypothetical protein
LSAFAHARLAGKTRQTSEVTAVELTKDLPTSEAENTHPDDPHQTGSGDAKSPGGKDAPTQSAGEMTHGGEAYPGPRAGGETDKLKDEPGDSQ